VIIAIGVLYIFLVVSTSFRSNQWFISGWKKSPHLLVIMGLPILLAQFFLIDNVIIKIVACVIVLAAIIQQLMIIWPYLPLSKDKNLSLAINHNKLTVASCNVLMHNSNYQQLVKDCIQLNADILFLTETNERWVEAFEEMAGTHPHKFRHPNEDTYGLMLLSKLPFEIDEVHYDPICNTPNISATIPISNEQNIRFYGIHPKPPLDDVRYRAQNLFFNELQDKIASESLPTIVTGDFNTCPWHPKLKKLLDSTKLKDPRKNRGLVNTFPQKFPLMPLDHIYFTNQFIHSKLLCTKLTGSDHLGLYLDLYLPKTET